MGNPETEIDTKIDTSEFPQEEADMRALLEELQDGGVLCGSDDDQVAVMAVADGLGVKIG